MEKTKSHFCFILLINLLEMSHWIEPTLKARTMKHSCVSFLSITVIKHHDQKQHLEERICFGRGMAAGSWEIVSPTTQRNRERAVGREGMHSQSHPSDVFSAVKLHLLKFPQPPNSTTVEKQLSKYLSPWWTFLLQATTTLEKTFRIYVHILKATLGLSKRQWLKSIRWAYVSHGNASRPWEHSSGKLYQGAGPSRSLHG